MSLCVPISLCPTLIVYMSRCSLVLLRFGRLIDLRSRANPDRKVIMQFTIRQWAWYPMGLGVIGSSTHTT